MKRFHSHKNGTAWEPENDVRYFFDLNKGVVVKTENAGGRLTRLTQITGSIDPEFSSQIILCAKIPKDHYIEVTEADLPYLKKPTGNEAEYCELRKPEVGDSALGNINKKPFVVCENYCFKDAEVALHGYRWCKPRKTAFDKWFEKMKPGSYRKKELCQQLWDYLGGAER